MHSSRPKQQARADNLQEGNEAKQGYGMLTTGNKNGGEARAPDTLDSSRAYIHHASIDGRRAAKAAALANDDDQLALFAPPFFTRQLGHSPNSMA